MEIDDTRGRSIGAILESEYLPPIEFPRDNPPGRFARTLRASNCPIESRHSVERPLPNEGLPRFFFTIRELETTNRCNSVRSAQRFFDPRLFLPPPDLRSSRSLPLLHPLSNFSKPSGNFEDREINPLRSRLLFHRYLYSVCFLQLT